ncbi:MAG: 2-C-methyl-D-erythritol 4-phosphate cytidylyltransferase [Ignavibacteria bacterium]|nr:2-C-methyl-D-erythritol 4-phosphate cytidylyltransferase [Ignavibacteria bacterium]
MRVIAIIPSAGLGRRIESSLKGKKSYLPKQFLKISGKEILIHTIEKFEQADFIDEILISSGREYLDHTSKLISKYKLKKVTTIVTGGEERQHSVYNAFKNSYASPSDLICVHDAVRPFISSIEINELILSAKKFKSIVAAVKASDTIKSGHSFVEKTLDRNKIWLVQTPQIFSYEILRKAFNRAWEQNFIGTDEASIVERIGRPVYFYEIKGENRKITTNLDLEYANFLLK